MTDPMPVFVIKAKDSLAMSAVEAYRILCRHSGMPGQADQVQLALDEIEAWQGRNPELVKAPYHRHIPARPATQTPPAAGLTADQADALIEFARQFWANLREAFTPIRAAFATPSTDRFPPEAFVPLQNPTGSRQRFWIEEYHRMRRQQGQLLDQIDRQRTTLDAVRTAIALVDDEDVTDWQRGYRACADRVTEALPKGPTSPPGSTHTAQQDDTAATHTDTAKPPTATTEGPTPTRANVLNLAANQLDQIAFARCAAPGDHQSPQCWTAEGISYAAAKLRDWAQNLPPTVVQTFAGP